MIMQKMRDGAQGIAAKVVVGLLVFVLAAFGFGSFNFFTAQEPVVATVNGEDITQRELDFAIAQRKQMLRGQFGEDATDEFLDRMVTPELMIETLIDRVLLTQTADELGLAISQDAVAFEIASLYTGVEGFDQATFTSYLRSMGYTIPAFQDEISVTERRDQLVQGFRETSFVTDRELRRAAALFVQTRDIAYLTFVPAEFAEAVEIDEVEIEDHYATFIENYTTEETFDFEFVRLPLSSLLEEAEVTEAEIEARYEDRRQDLLASPKRRGSHILLEINDERTLEDAVAELSEVREKVLAGEDFAEFARELSEDAGSAEQGGDLGFAGRGDFVPAFEDALWSLSEGELSEPVQSQFGVHLIRLEEILAVEIPPLEVLRGELTLELREEAARAVFEERLRTMDERAFEESTTLTGLGEEFGLELERLDGITREHGEGVLADFAVRNAWFAEDVVDGGFNTQAVASSNDEIIVARLVTNHPPEEIPLEEVREAIRGELIERRSTLLAADAAQEALDALNEGEAVGDVAERFGLEWQRADGTLLQNPEVDREILDKAFEMPTPAKGERDRELVSLSSGATVLLVLSRVHLGDYTAMTEEEQSLLRSNLSESAAERGYSVLINSLRKEADIDMVLLGGGDEA